MQRTDAQVIDDHAKVVAKKKQLERELRKGGVRLTGRSPLHAFAAGSSKAKIKAAAKAAKGRAQ